MSHDLVTQLREYGEYQHEMRQPVTVEDLERLVDHRMVPKRPSRPNGPFIAIAVLVGVLLLVGGAAFLFSGSGGEQPADSVVLTTPPESAPTTAVDSTPTTAVTVPETPTTIAESATSINGVIAETLEMLDIALEQEEVRNSHGLDVRAQLDYVYSYLTGMAGSAGWPEPAVDTSLLGVESVLREVDPDARLLDAVSHRPSAGSGGVVVNPFVAAAGLEGTTINAAFGIVLAFKDDIVDIQWRLATGLQRSSALAISQWDAIDLPPTIIMVHGPRSGVDEPAFIGGLPLEASVVTTTFSDGTKVWQRPISGIAIFEDPNKQCVGVSEFDSCAFEYTVLDADGDEIFRIVSDPDHEPFGFRLDSP